MRVKMPASGQIVKRVFYDGCGDVSVKLLRGDLGQVQPGANGEMKGNVSGFVSGHTDAKALLVVEDPGEERPLLDAIRHPEEPSVVIRIELPIVAGSALPVRMEVEFYGPSEPRQ